MNQIYKVKTHILISAKKCENFYETYPSTQLRYGELEDSREGLTEEYILKILVN